MPLPLGAHSLESVDVQTGFFTGSLSRQGTYKAVPLLVASNLDARPLFEKIGIKSKGKINFVVEPFLNTVIRPAANIEAGTNFLFRYVFPLSKKVQPFIKGGVGVGYMSQHLEKQSTQYNFLPQAGMGCLFFLKERLALSIEYRFRHLSNAGLKQPNGGVNVGMGLVGISWFF